MSQLVQNVKVKEFCCGCSLRTGSLILLWIGLVVESISILIYMYEFTYGNKYTVEFNDRYYRGDKDYKPLSILLLSLHSLYYLVVSIAGLISAIFGIIGIQKNAPKYLNFALYYLCYFAVHLIVTAFLAIFLPKTYSRIVMSIPKILQNLTMEFIFVGFVAYLFFISILVYFYVVIRSCRDSMLKNRETGQVEIPDPTVFGYSAA